MESIQIPLKEEALQDENGHGILFLCPTPIGNMEDITYRTLKILASVDYVAAEDTRHSGRLLQYYGIHKPFISYHEHNKEEKAPEILQKLAMGASIAVVSDAGMPAISDPGYDIVVRALQEGYRVVPLPGANAGLTALMASGLSTEEFTFIGFLPRRKKHRDEILSRIANYAGTLIFYEAPHRLYDMLQAVLDVLGPRRVVVAREITKKFETFTRSDIETLVREEPLTMKGEFVILVEGAVENKEMVYLMTPEEEVYSLMQEGISKKEAVKEVAKKRNVSRREVYNSVERAREDI